MSRVTNVILATFIDDNAGVETLNHLLAKDDYGQLAKVDHHAGGHKAVEADIYFGAFNYLQIDVFVAAFRDAKWKYPESAQLMLKTEEEERFEVFDAIKTP